MIPVAEDIFNPVLKSPDSLMITPSAEQLSLINQVIALTSSDSMSAIKAKRALEIILAGSVVKAPRLDSLNPATASVVDTPESIELHALGSGFNQSSQIVWNGSAVPTTFISENELSAQVDVQPGPGDEAVFVLNGDTNMLSSGVNFSVTTPVGV